MTTKVEQNTGKPSPRWAFFSRYFIPCHGGEQYLTRLRIVDTPWFGIYLHDIFHPDDGRNPHDHPWPFLSIVLRGEYTEKVYPYPENGRPGNWGEKTHKRFSIHRMGTSGAHRIVHASPRLKTLIIRGKRRPGWGFYTEKGYIPWQEYTP